MAARETTIGTYVVDCDFGCGVTHEPADRADAASAHGAGVSALRADWAVSAMWGEGVLLVVDSCPACKVPIHF